MAEAVELVEGVEVQLRQELVAGDQELELGDADQELLRTMSGWNESIWARLASQSGSSRASVGAVTGTIRRLSAGGRPRMLRSCRSVVITSEVPRHEVEPELFELLLGLGDVGDGAAADLQLGLLAREDLLGELDGLLAAPELDVLLGQGSSIAARSTGPGP